MPSVILPRGHLDIFQVFKLCLSICDDDFLETKTSKSSLQCLHVGFLAEKS